MEEIDKILLELYHASVNYHAGDESYYSKIICCQDEIRSLVKKKPTWEPIETAPKDGKIILVYESGSTKIQISKFLPDSNIWLYRLEPTHWLAIPEPEVSE